jgi:hypothetical protein
MELALLALVAAPFTAVYLILSCAVCAPLYITRPDTFYGLFFFGMLILLVLFRQIIRHLPRTRIAVPLLLAILAFECNTEDITYSNSMYFNLSAEVCYRVDNDILQQLKGAIDAGEQETILLEEVCEYKGKQYWTGSTTRYVTGAIAVEDCRKLLQNGLGAQMQDGAPGGSADDLHDMGHAAAENMSGSLVSGTFGGGTIELSRGIAMLMSNPT